MDKQSMALVGVLLLGLAAATVWLLQPAEIPVAAAQNGQKLAQPVGAQAQTNGSQRQAAAKRRSGQSKRAGQQQRRQPKADNTAMLRKATLAVTAKFATEQSLDEQQTTALVAEMTRLLDESQVIYDKARGTPGTKPADTRQQMMAIRKDSRERIIALIGEDKTALFLRKLKRH